MAEGVEGHQSGRGQWWQVRIRVDGSDLECVKKGSGRDKMRRVRRERDKSHQQCKVCSLWAQNSVGKGRP